MSARRTWMGAALAALLLGGCAPPAVVFISQRYTQAAVHQVVLAGFLDYPGSPGSGDVASSLFEKYLLLAGYGLADRGQAQTLLASQGVSLTSTLGLAALNRLNQGLGVDAVVIGQITDYSDASDRTVMEDLPLEQTSPIMGHQTTVQRVGDQRVRTESDVVTGYATSTTDVPVQTTESVDAHAGLSVRLVDARTGEMLWSGSASADAPHLQAALEDASASVMQAVAKRLKQKP